jgi:hypothetical protein
MSTSPRISSTHISPARSNHLLTSRRKAWCREPRGGASRVTGQLGINAYEQRHLQARAGGVGGGTGSSRVLDGPLSRTDCSRLSNASTSFIAPRCLPTMRARCPGRGVCAREQLRSMWAARGPWRSTRRLVPGGEPLPGTGRRRTALIPLASSRHAMLAHHAGEVPGQGCVRARTAAIDAGSARSVAIDEAASARAGAAPRNRATAHCADSFWFFTPRADDFVDAATT